VTAITFSPRTHRFGVFEIEFTIPPGTGFQKDRLADGYWQRLAIGPIQFGAFHELLPSDYVSDQQRIAVREDVLVGMIHFRLQFAPRTGEPAKAFQSDVVIPRCPVGNETNAGPRVTTYVVSFHSDSSDA
jgi:hypothetical protein